MNALNFVKKEKRADQRVWFAIDPSIAYPAMLTFFLLAKQDNESAEMIPAQYRPQVLGLNVDQLTLKQDRAAVLDVVRLVLTEMLHKQTNHEPMGIHILKNKEWRL